MGATLLDVVIALSGAGALMCLVALVYGNRRRPVKRTSAISRETSNSLDRLLREAGMPSQLTSKTFPILRLGTTVGGALLGWPLMGHIVVIVGAGAGWFGPMIVVRQRVASRQRRLDRELNDVLQMMQTMLASGSTLLATIDALGDKFAPGEYREVFEDLSRNLRGSTRVAALGVAQKRVNSPIFDRLIGYLIISETLGVPLTPLLKNAQEEIRTQTSMIGRLTAMATQTKMAGIMIGVMMGGGIFALQLIQGSGSYWAPYFSFPGNLIELFAMSMFVGGAMLISRMQRVPRIDRLGYRADVGEME